MEKEEFDSLFSRFYEPLCNYASKFIGNDNHAEDIVQNVFIKILDRYPNIDIQKPERYLVKAVKFRCIDHLRANSTRQEIPVDPNKIPEQTVDENIPHENDQLAIVTYLIALLPEKTRQIFTLSRQSGLTYREIAMELDISIKTVENQMGRALRILRTGYQQYLNRQ